MTFACPNGWSLEPKIRPETVGFSIRCMETLPNVVVDAVTTLLTVVSWCRPLMSEKESS